MTGSPVDGVRLFWVEGETREIRIPKAARSGTVSGYFDSPVALVDALGAASWDGTASIYITPNPCDPAVLARAANRLQPYARETTKDSEILRRQWFLTDFDPVRLAGISSTDAEVAAALARRDAAVEFCCTQLGFPEPVLAMSGNGGHALWAVDEPNDGPTKTLFETALKALSARFSDATVTVDTSVFNASRIWKLYGSVAMKGDAVVTGDSAIDRPHRRSALEGRPDPLVRLPRAGLEALAALYQAPSRNGSQPPPGAVDLVALFRARGLYLRALDGGKHAVTCPWAREHSGDSGLTETVVFDPSDENLGLGGFRCLHDHCTARGRAEVLVYFAGTASGSASTTDAPLPPRDSEAPVTLEDFYGYALGGYLYVPTRDLWPAASVDARLPRVRVGTDAKGKPVTLPASVWLGKHRPVEQLTWSPGDPALIHDRLMAEGGWIPHAGARVFNLYRPPRLVHGDKDQAGKWVDHVTQLYPGEAEHLFRWFAHRVQFPHVKVNHAIVLGGAQGIGKDSLLEPIVRAVGPWNTGETSPTTLTGRFNPFLKSVLLRVSEARDLGDVNRYAFYDAIKTLLVMPPDVLIIDEKNLKTYRIPNLVAIVLTTNYRDGLYLPEDDRRHFVCWSEVTRDAFPTGYWPRLWQWFDAEGAGHVAAWLAALDLTGFDPKADPPKTPAFYALVSTGRAPEADELADVLAGLTPPNPPAFALEDVLPLITLRNPVLSQWLTEPKNRRAVPHRLEDCGYVPVRNPHDARGRWSVRGAQRVVYGLRTLSERDRYAAVRAYIERAAQ